MENPLKKIVIEDIQEDSFLLNIPNLSQGSIIAIKNRFLYPKPSITNPPNKGAIALPALPNELTNPRYLPLTSFGVSWLMITGTWGKAKASPNVSNIIATTNK